MLDVVVSVAGFVDGVTDAVVCVLAGDDVRQVYAAAMVRLWQELRGALRTADALAHAAEHAGVLGPSAEVVGIAARAVGPLPGAALRHLGVSSAARESARREPRRQGALGAPLPQHLLAGTARGCAREGGR